MNSLCFFILMICSLGWAQDYCSLCSDHTMCLYPNIDSMGKCGEIIERGVSDDDKNFIVNYHNELRANLANGNEHRGLNGQSQPGAKNMHKIYWNDEIATIAQRWADQCNWGDTCRSTDQWGWVGENIFLVFSGGELGNGADFKAALDGFWNEVDSFDPNNINPYQFSESTGHYTEMAWAETAYVGCGYTQFHAPDGQYNKYYVCNYGPGGNIGGASMYNVGNACEDCPGNCENGLCT